MLKTMYVSENQTNHKIQLIHLKVISLCLKRQVYQKFEIKFLVCGSYLTLVLVHNVLPLRDSDTNKEETNFQFLTANDTPTKCFGKTDLEIDIGFEKTTATFHICAIEQPVLGIHFMHQNRLTLDAQLGCLRCPDTEMKVNTIPMPVKECEALPVHERKYTDLLDLYPNLTTAPNYRKPVKHDIVHHLPTKGRPPNIKTRGVSPEKYRKTR